MQRMKIANRAKTCDLRLALCDDGSLQIVRSTSFSSTSICSGCTCRMCFKPFEAPWLACRQTDSPLIFGSAQHATLQRMKKSGSAPECGLRGSIIKGQIPPRTKTCSRESGLFSNSIVVERLRSTGSTCETGATANAIAKRSTNVGPGQKLLRVDDETHSSQR